MKAIEPSKLRVGQNIRTDPLDPMSLAEIVEITGNTVLLWRGDVGFMEADLSRHETVIVGGS